RLYLASIFMPNIEDVRRLGDQWRKALFALIEQVELLALPTLPIFPPRVEDLVGDQTPLVIDITRHTGPFNLAGTPALALPVPIAGGHLPASLQLVGPLGGEELLVATGRVVEAAVA